MCEQPVVCTSNKAASRNARERKSNGGMAQYCVGSFKAYPDIGEAPIVA